MSQKFSIQKSVSALSLVLAGAAGTFIGVQSFPSKAQLSEQPIAQLPAPIPSNTAPNFIATAVERTGSAVVRINSSRNAGRERNAGSDRVLRGTGSGFIIKSDGLILTNAHVLDRADKVSVTLKDGRNFTGQVLGTDELTDVAVIKIQASNLPTVSIGNSQQLKAGEWAIAIGNPLGLDNTVTAGIISGTGRSSSVIGAPDKRVSFIQTDAAINPGNSGGPLLNQQGQVIGMNTAIVGGAQGLGFAIPIDTAQRIADQLIANGEANHPYLGIQMATITPSLKESLNSDPSSDIRVQADRGVVVIDVVANSPAARAGLQAGDVISQINNQAIVTAEELQQALDASTIGSDLPLEVLRNGRSLALSVRPGEFPS